MKSEYQYDIAYRDEDGSVVWHPHGTATLEAAIHLLEIVFDREDVVSVSIHRAKRIERKNS